MPEPSPIRPADDDARSLARGLIGEARHGALAVIHPDHGGPSVTRVAVGTTPQGVPVLLVSDLSLHTRALGADPRAALLLGEPGPRGDPLTHPRLTLQARARFIGADDPERSALRSRYLAQHPKAKLYIDFADFRFAELEVLSAALNGGFGRAFELTPADLGYGGG